MKVGRPVTSSATSLPVLAAVIRPIWPWPKANVTLRDLRAAADHWHRIRQAGSMAHPFRHLAAFEAGQHLAAVSEQDVGSAVVGRGVETGNLDRAGKAHTVLHRRGDELPLGPLHVALRRRGRARRPWRDSRAGFRAARDGRRLPRALSTTRRRRPPVPRPAAAGGGLDRARAVRRRRRWRSTFASTISPPLRTNSSASAVVRPSGLAQWPCSGK